MGNVLIYLGITVLQMLVFGVYVKDFIGFRRPVKYFPVCWICFSIMDRLVINITDASGVISAVHLLGAASIVFWMCLGSWKKKLLLVISFEVMGMIIEVILVNIAIMTGVCDMNTVRDDRISCLLMAATQMLLFVLLQIVNYFWGRRIRQMAEGRAWIGILLVSFGCFAANIILTIDMIRDNRFSAGYVAVLVLLMCTNYLSYYFYLVSGENNRLETEAKVQAEQIRMYQQWYGELKHSRKETQSFRHDIRNHFGILRSICEKGKENGSREECIEEIRKYLDSVENSYQGVVQEIDSGNLSLDAMVGMKKAYAESKGILMKTEIYVPKKMTCNSMDLVIILGNLMDNAIEACEKVEEEKREIILKISYTMKNLFLMITNTYDGGLDGSSGPADGGGLLKTSKSDSAVHGIGMKNVVSTVDKYSGDMRWKADQGIFTVEILLYGVDS